MAWKLTEGLRKLIAALGCDPTLCHACGSLMEVGSELGLNRGLIVHRECRDLPELALPLTEEIRERISKDLSTLSGLVTESGSTYEEVIDSGWRSKSHTLGPPPADLLREFGLLAGGGGNGKGTEGQE